MRSPAPAVSARIAAVVVSAAVAAAAFAPSTAAQLAPEAAAGWPAPEVGARVGLSNVEQDVVLGALLRIPVIRSASVELMPSADVTFLRGIKEYQVNLEAAYVMSGRDGGLYAGGGIGLRNTLPPSSSSGVRENLRTYSVVVGLKLTELGPVNALFEFRRIFASELVVDPQMISLGATLGLW